MITVKKVLAGSPAEKCDIRAYDIIISVNGHEVNDILDLNFYSSERSLSILIHRGPELYTKKVRKGEYEDIGILSDTFLMDDKKTCKNKCIFCFIDQNPPGMRDTIYFKDDDSRLSFLHGCYVTLTNMTDRDIDRIIEMHMSPINVSVHTTDPELRVKMLKNKRSGEVLSYIKRLTDAGITVNCQIVLCKGINDGEALLKTMRDLAVLYPGIGSVSIVPSGLTRHRDGLFPLIPFEKEDALAVIEQVNAFANAHLESKGSRLFFCSDELYLKAELPLPSSEYYEEYPQIENGVGMLTSLKDEFYEELEYLAEDYNTDIVRCVSIATGSAAFSLISSLASELEKRCSSLKIHVYEIKNRFFGESVTVAGLICGCDLKEQLIGKPLGERLILPSVMLRDEGDRFLDDVTAKELSEHLSVPIALAEISGSGFIKSIME